MAKSDTVLLTSVYKAAFGVLLVAFALHAVGFSTSNWVTGPGEDNHTYHAGLWQSCWDDKCTGGSNHDLADQGWFKFVQTFEALGFASQAIGVIISVTLFTAVSNHRLARVNVHVSVFAGVFMAIGTGTFTWKTPFELLGYSCWLTWASSLVIVFAIVLLECDHHKKSSAKRNEIIQLQMVPLEHVQNGYKHTHEFGHHLYDYRHHHLPDRSRPNENHVTGVGHHVTDSRHHVTVNTRAINQNRRGNGQYWFAAW